MNQLRDAVFRQDLNEVKQLVAQGVAIDELDGDGRTPLMHAAIDKLTEIAEFLIINGANVSHRDNHQWTALHFAARDYEFPLVELFLKNGADIDAQDRHGNTPLMGAVYNFDGDDRLLKLLIDAGADRNMKNKHDVSPHDLANTISPKVPLP